MNIRSIILSFLLVSGYLTHAQEEMNLEVLKVPTSPASTILGVQPNEVAQPKSAKDVEAAILSNYLDENNSITIPNNYSLEFMPYWIGDRKNVNYDDYIKNTFGAAVWQNLSVSISSTKNFVLNDTLNTNAMGIGVRTLLRRGKFGSEYESVLTAIRDYQVDLAFFPELTAYLSHPVLTGSIPRTGTNKDVYDALLVVYKANDATYIALAATDKSERDKIFKEMGSRITENYLNDADFEEKLQDIFVKVRLDIQYKKLKEKYKNFITKRAGFQLEAAGALSINFPDNDFENKEVPKWGIWFTGTFNPGMNASKDSWNKNLQGILMLRYLRNDKDFYQTYLPVDSAGFYENNFDFGSRVIWSKKKFSLEAEYLLRYRKSLLEKSSSENGITQKTERSGWDYKLMVNLNYTLSDKMVLSYNIGKDLDPTVAINGNIISSISLNLGFGGAMQSSD